MPAIASRYAKKPPLRSGRIAITEGQSGIDQNGRSGYFRFHQFTSGSEIGFRTWPLDDRPVSAGRAAGRPRGPHPTVRGGRLRSRSRTANGSPASRSSPFRPAIEVVRRSPAAPPRHPPSTGARPGVSAPAARACSHLRTSASSRLRRCASRPLALISSVRRDGFCHRCGVSRLWACSRWLPAVHATGSPSHGRVLGTGVRMLSPKANGDCAPPSGRVPRVSALEEMHRRRRHCVCSRSPP